MEKIYTIEENNAIIKVNKQIYPIVVVEKALSNYLEKAYVKLDLDKDNIKIQINVKDNKADLEKIIGEFYNELLRESLRYKISLETKNIRELIIGRALYATCIDTKNDKEEDSETTENYNLDEIAVNWFDKYKKEEG